MQQGAILKVCFADIRPPSLPQVILCETLDQGAC